MRYKTLILILMLLPLFTSCSEKGSQVKVQEDAFLTLVGNSGEEILEISFDYTRVKLVDKHGDIYYHELWQGE